MTTEIFKAFADRFNKSDTAKPASALEVEKLEKEFKVFMPADFKDFLLRVGNIFTPNILSLIVDKNIELNGVQEFWDIERITWDKKNEWTSKLETDLIPFASDCLGNLFAFMASDIKQQKQTAVVYLFDHEFDTIEKKAASFTEWVDGFNKI
ncbi:MAG TPA: SMI1/KNR4 family protein [Bacteroidia bacterium]|jgi:hypothetical protein|nr:SMI1/KNR4 family protein [Bacteroidia bacterium]